MRKRILLALTLLAAAGCVETPERLCRQYCTATNEHIDALMMITSEQQAKSMTTRVLSNMSGRYKALDNRCEIIEANFGKNPNGPPIKDFFESEELRVYRAENRTNIKRFSTEMERLQNLLDQLVEAAKQKARDGGGNPNAINADELFPSLNAIVNKKNTIAALRTELEQPRLEQMLARFKKK